MKIQFQRYSVSASTRTLVKMPNMKRKLEKKLVKKRPGHPSIQKNTKPQSAVETQSGFDDSNTEQLDNELSGLEQSDQELSGNDESDPRLSREEQSYIEQLWAEQSGAEQSGEEQSGEEQSGEEKSGAEQSGEEQSDLEQSGAERVAEKHFSQQRPPTPPRLDELLSSEAIGEGTVADRKREFLSRLAAFTERIYRPDGRVNYCKFCKKTYTSNQNFRIHMETMHKEKKDFDCKKCNKKFAMESLLRRHQTFFCDNAFKCSLCRKVCTGPEELKEHKLMQHKRTEKCETCGKYFRTKYHLKVHKRIHRIEKPFVCTVEGCEESFPVKSQREWHLDQKHTSDETGYRHTCSVCSNKFQTSQQLRRHRYLHHRDCSAPKRKNTIQNGPFLYLCPDCGKGLKHRKSVKPHQMLHARGLKPKTPKNGSYPCKVCNENFLMKKDLAIHMSAVHKKESYPCKVCNENFLMKKDLAIHMSTVHTKESYPCKVCRENFLKKKDLVI